MDGTIAPARLLPSSNQERSDCFILAQEWNRVGKSLAVVPGREQPTPPVAVHGRTRADFLAHLIATVVQVPQARARRRAEPDEAVAAYGNSDRPRGLTGRTLYRSL